MVRRYDDGVRDHGPVRRFGLLVVVGVVLTIATLAVAGKAGAQPSCATGSVLELELARTEAKAVDLVGGCDEAGLDEIRDALHADTYGFLPLYVVSVAFWCVLGGRRLTWSTDRRRQVVLAAAVAIVVAGCFDLVENHFLGQVVDAAGADGVIGTATAASYVKWVLVLFAVPTSVVAMVRGVRAAVTRSALPSGG
jgi:hypothetical protein